MKINFRILASFLLFFSLGSQAAPPSTNEAKLKKLLEHTTSLSQVYFMMAFAGASKDSLRTIHADIMKTGGKTTFPKLSLVGNNFQVNGHMTGMKITSYQPLEINYKGQIWTYSANKPMDENYFALKNLMRPKPQARAPFFLPEAYALDSVNPRGFEYESMAGVAAGGLIGTMTCSATILACAPFMYFGVIGGAAEGMVFISASSNGKTLDQETPRVKITCTAQNVSISNTNEGTFSITKSTDGGLPKVQRLVPHAGWVDASKEVAENWDDFDALAKCNSPAQAQQLEDKLNGSRDMAIYAMTGYYPGGQPLPDSTPAATQ